MAEEAILGLRGGGGLICEYEGGRRGNFGVEGGSLICEHAGGRRGHFGVEGGGLICEYAGGRRGHFAHGRFFG